MWLKPHHPARSPPGGEFSPPESARASPHATSQARPSSSPSSPSSSQVASQAITRPPPPSPLPCPGCLRGNGPSAPQAGSRLRGPWDQGAGQLLQGGGGWGEGGGSMEVRVGVWSNGGGGRAGEWQIFDGRRKGRVSSWTWEWGLGWCMVPATLRQAHDGREKTGERAEREWERGEERRLRGHRPVAGIAGLTGPGSAPAPLSRRLGRACRADKGPAPAIEALSRSLKHAPCICRPLGPPLPPPPLHCSSTPPPSSPAPPSTTTLTSVLSRS